MGTSGEARDGAGRAAWHESPTCEEPQCVHHLQSQLQPLQIVPQHSHRAAVALRAAARRARRAGRADARRRERGMEAAVPPRGEVAVGEVGAAHAQQLVRDVL